VLLEQKVAVGKLGVKSKSGFYEYPLKKKKQTPIKMQEVLQQITHWYLDGVFDVYNKSICTKDELEHIVEEYMMIEKSPFELADEIGYTFR
jgi:3-hydroxyacyl-CoA dehydrogenase